jgi:hypothetical protein
MWFSPQTLSLITTHRCTAACEHCCFGCSPAEERAIPLPRLRALIEETAEVPSLRQVVFTGGECFLLGPALDDLIRRCRRLGLASRCVSNGYWAVSAGAATARVAALRDAGLDELSLSTGVFHARFVPWERVVWAAAAAAEAGLGVVINVETFAGAAFDGAELAEHPLLRPFLAAGMVRLIRGAWIPNGGEWGREPAPLGHAEGLLRFRGEAGHSACLSSLRVVSITPDQDLVSCCGLNLEHIPQLHVGSIRDRSLGQALAEVQPDLLKMWLHVEGPERVLEFVRDRLPGFALPLDSAHICHTCQFLHASPEAMATLARYQQEVEGRILERYLLVCAGDEVLAQLPAG